MADPSSVTLNFFHLLETWEYLKYMYLIELDETNRLSLISLFYLKSF